MARARLIDDVGVARPATEQMARDEAMLEEVARGEPAVLRLYTWETPALSLGRFQREDEVDRDACTRHGVEVVRRPSGGRAILHGGDLTYALATLRPDEPVRTTFCHIASALIEGLALLGVASEVTSRGPSAGPACFTGAAGADLRVGERKLCGSAMVRRGGAVLQHGSVLLRRLPIDESDLLRGAQREELLRATTTLEELGAAISASEVAAALAQGFARALDLDLDHRSRIRLPGARSGRSLA